MVFRMKRKGDPRYCEDPRHNTEQAKGEGGRLTIGVIETRVDSYAVCESCYQRIAKAMEW